MTGVVTRQEPVATQRVTTVARDGARFPLRAPGLDALFALLFGVAGWCIGLRRLGDNSFLWHWRTGHLIVAHGIPHADPFSFTAHGAPWVAQSWLAEIAYAVADNLMGGFGIRLLIALTGAGIGYLLYRLALRSTRDRVRAAVLSTIALSSIITIWSERPLLFGLLAMAVLVLLVEFPDSWPGRHELWMIPVVMWLWANVHGTFSIGYVYLLLHLAGRWADGAPFWEGRERRLVIGGLVSFGALFANPYGLSLVLFPLELMRRGSVLAGVAEWNSPNFRELGGMLFAAWLVTVVVLLARSRPSRRDVIVAVPFLFLALWAVRNVGLATLVTVPIAGRSWASIGPVRVRSQERSRLGWAFGAGLMVLALVWATNASTQPDFNLASYPVTALHQVQEQGYMGRRMFTTDAWAGYVIARWWPQQHVYMDDRYDMYPKQIVADYDTIADVAPAWKHTLDEYRIDVVVWPAKRSLTQALAEDHDWRQVYADKKAAVFVRTAT
jgi:hypothetical protein